LYACIAEKYNLYVDTPRIFIIAKLSIRKPESFSANNIFAIIKKRCVCTKYKLYKTLLSYNISGHVTHIHGLLEHCHRLLDP
jgi:hypothetical protein